MKKIWVVLGIIAAIFCIWFFARSVFYETVKVVHPQFGTAIQAAYATGTVEPEVMLPIATHVSARLLKINADEGNEVVKDQILGQLEDQQLVNLFKELKEREELAKKRYERNVPLVKSGVVSKDEFDRTLTEWQAAQASMEAAQAQVSYLKLVAPEDGLIVRRDGEIGQLIPANQAVFWLARKNSLRITTEVDEEDIAQVKPGQTVLIRADAFPQRIFNGKVQSITPKGDPIARSYRVRVSLDKGTPLLIGMTAETNIIFGEKKHALLLPTSSLIQDKVWLVKKGRLVETKVVVGAKGLKQIELLEGVKPDDLVVLLPKETLVEGRKVNTILIKQEE